MRPVLMILARQWSELCDLPVLLVDADARLVHGNEAAAALLGGDALAGSPAWEVFAARVRAGASAEEDLPPAEAVRVDRPFCRLVHLRRRDGGVVETPLVYVPMLGLGGERQGGMLILGQSHGGPSSDDSLEEEPS